MENTSYLKIRAEDDDDGTSALRVAVCFEGFSGRGEAWFNKSQLQSFVEELAALVETGVGLPRLESGYLGADGRLKSTLVSLRFSSITSYRFRVRVHLEEHPSTDCSDDEVLAVDVGLMPTVHELTAFVSSFRNLLLGSTQKAVLEL